MIDTRTPLILFAYARVVNYVSRLKKQRTSLKLAGFEVLVINDFAQDCDMIIIAKTKKILCLEHQLLEIIDDLEDRGHADARGDGGSGPVPGLGSG